MFSKEKIMTSWQNESVVFYSRMAELQHKLKKSEEERLGLEKKFNSILQSCQAEQEAKIKSLRNNYTKLLEHDRMRCERNDNIMQTLKRVENRASMITAKTDRLRLLRHHYEAYMSRLYPDWKKELGNANTTIPQIINTDTGNLYTEYSSNASMLDPLTPTKNNYFNNLPIHTQSNEKPTEAHSENILSQTYKLSSLDLPHMQIPADSITQNKSSLGSKPYQLRRKLFEDIPLSGTTSEEPQYQHHVSSHYESFVPTKLGGYSVPDQNHSDGNIHNGIVGDFEIDQNTSDLLSATLSDDGTIKDIPKETKSYDLSGPKFIHPPFTHANGRYSEINNNENKYSKNISTPSFYTPPGIRKPVARTSSFDFPSRTNIETEIYKKSLFTRRPSILTDTVPSVNSTLNKNISHSYPKSVIHENSSMDGMFKKYLMDTERPYSIESTYDPKFEVPLHTKKVDELIEKEKNNEYIKSVPDKYTDDRLQTVRNYDSRSVHFASNPLTENEKLRNNGSSYEKCMNRFSELNSERNFQPPWHDTVKLNDSVKSDKNELFNSTPIDNKIQDEKNTSFYSSNTKPTTQNQSVVKNSSSTPSFVFTEYRSPDDTKDDQCGTVAGTEIYPSKPNKESIQEISQEECIQFPKEKTLEQFPEHTSEQFYRLQVVAEHPQEQADELKTDDKTSRLKSSSDYKHDYIKEIQNLNENLEHGYNLDMNTEYPSQTANIEKTPHRNEHQVHSLQKSADSSDGCLTVPRVDNKFYENAIEQLRIEAQKNENLLGSSTHEQEWNKDKIGQINSACEPKILGPDSVSKTGKREEIICDSNSQRNNNKDINKSQESQQIKVDNQSRPLYKNETDTQILTNSEQTENSGKLSQFEQEINPNECAKPPTNIGNSNSVNDTLPIDVINDHKIMTQLLPTASSGGMTNDIVKYDDPKEEISSDSVKFKTTDSRVDGVDWSITDLQNTSDSKLLEEIKDKTETKEDETNFTANKESTENIQKVITQTHEYSGVDKKEAIQSNLEVRAEPEFINNEGNKTENVMSSGHLQECREEINKHEGDADNNQYAHNINIGQWNEYDRNVSNQNEDYPNNKEQQNEELAINTLEQLDESDQMPLSSNEPHENEQVFESINQQYSGTIPEENKVLTDYHDSELVDQQQAGIEAEHYKNYYPETTENQEGDDYNKQQYYNNNQQQEYYPNQNVEEAEYSNYGNESDDHYKSYAGEDNQTNQYGTEVNYECEQEGKNECEQQQVNYQGNFDESGTYGQQYEPHYDDNQQYNKQDGNYENQYDNRDQYQHQGQYNSNQYEQEGIYSTDQYEQQQENYQQNYENGDYIQQEGDYQHNYHDNQYEQGDYQKNGDQYEQQERNYNGVQYEHQEGEYSTNQYEQQEGNYPQNYNENDQFLQQGAYEQNYDPYEQYNLPEESGYTRNMQPSDNLQTPGAEFAYSAEGNELQDTAADHDYRQGLETDQEAVTDEHLQPNMDDTKIQPDELKTQRNLAKVLESDSDSVNIGKDQNNDDSSEFDFSSHNEQNNT